MFIMQYLEVLNQMIQWLASFSAWEGGGGGGGEVKRSRENKTNFQKHIFAFDIFHISSLTLVIANQKMQPIHQVISYCIIIFLLFSGERCYSCLVACPLQRQAVEKLFRSGSAS